MKAQIPAFLIIFICINHHVLAQWDKYPTYDEYLALMEKFEADYPELCKIEEIGESVQGRKLLVAKVSDSVNKEEAEPEFLYNATIHGDETGGYIFMLRLIDTLLSSYSSDSHIKHLVDNIEIWIAPLCNPDGTYQNNNSTVIGARRNNANNKDLNRNFPCPCKQGNHPYGIYDSLEKETKALIYFLQGHNFVMSANLQAGVESAIYPWNCMRDHHPDEEWFKYVAKEYADTAHTNSPDGYFNSISEEGYSNGWYWYEQHGTLIDYQTSFRHCRAIAIFLSTRKLLGEHELNDYWNYNFRSFLDYLEQVLYGIRGTITSYVTGEPIYNDRVKIFITNHDIDNSYVYDKLPCGDFYRPVIEGLYNIRFSVDGFENRTYYNIKVANKKATTMDAHFMGSMVGYLYLTSPNGGETFERGELCIITFNGTIKPDNVLLLKDGVFSDTLENTGQWKIPPNFPTGNNYRIHISGYDGMANYIYDQSNANFSIVDSSTIIKFQENETIPKKELIKAIFDPIWENIKVSFTLTQKANVQIDIYSLKGKLIKHFDEGVKNAGYYNVFWNGKDNTGRQISNGCYIVHVDLGDKTLAKRFVFSR